MKGSHFSPRRMACFFIILSFQTLLNIFFSLLLTAATEKNVYKEVIVLQQNCWYVHWCPLETSTLGRGGCHHAQVWADLPDGAWVASSEIRDAPMEDHETAVRPCSSSLCPEAQEQHYQECATQCQAITEQQFSISARGPRVEQHIILSH